MNRNNLCDKAHRASINNRNNLLSSKTCGCFFCCTIFSPKKINDWIINDYENEGTALCPICGVDAVIGTKSGFPVSIEFLESMHEKWFN